MKAPLTYFIFSLLFVFSCSKNDDSEPLSYIVKFNSNGGSSVADQNLENGEKVTRPATPTKAEYNFVNWFKESSLTTVFDFNNETINADKTLHAKWDKLKYTVTFESNGGSIIGNQNIAYGEKATKPTDIDREGYSFENWFLEETFATVFDFDTEIVTSNITLYAKWSKSYIVAFDLNNGTGSAIESQNIVEGEQANNPSSDAVLFCLDFNGWHTDQNMNSPFDFTEAINENVTLYARYDNSSFTYNPNTKIELQALVNTQTDLSLINTCAITDMSELFKDKKNTADFNGSLSNWNVSNVTSMNSMFEHAINFNQDISFWDVSNVTDLTGMFEGASVFNQPLNNWDVSNVTSLSVMFRDAKAFNQPLNSWNVSSVERMFAVFQSANSFNQPLDNWDVSKVLSMRQTFDSAVSFDQNLNSWDVSNVREMTGMFSNTKAFNQPLNLWNVSMVDSFRIMFRNAENFNQPLNTWDVSNSTDMGSMFASASKFNQDLGNWDVSSVTTMSNMFFTSSEFNQDLSAWDVSKVTNMNRMFFRASNFDQNINSWDVSNVTNMEEMFFQTKFNQNLNLWNVSKVTNMESMFSGSLFNQIEIKSWNIQENTVIAKMLRATEMPTTFRFDTRPNDNPF